MSTASFGSRFTALHSFADRILGGEAVFFVGAGFSLDSEGLTAARLVQRLLLRLYALDQLPVGTGTVDGQPGQAIRKLANLFGTAPTLREIAADWSHVERLANRYYEVNEWMCRTYGQLLHLSAPDTNFHTHLAKHEADARDLTSWTKEEFQRLPDPWLLRARAAKTAADRTELGKLLFVQTLGFHDPTVMGGEPFDTLHAPSLTPPNLKPRHHILARFAREGFCPALLTTNFDLLLEAAYRLSGFACAGKAANHAASLTALQNFDVIASPQDFFERGKAYRTATILKIHGCAGHLRHLANPPKRDPANPSASPAVPDAPDPLDAQLHYLPQLVYTYREIQHWRDDSWAADYLRTLLRTRAMIFAGYSTADPVLHATFRSIYEEMHRKRARPSLAATAAPNCDPTPTPAQAPAYFLAYSPTAETHEFHAAEILRSATLATGIDADTDTPASPHPNYLRFRRSDLTDPAYPALDELLGWTQHHILRRQQLDALTNELPALIARLDRRRPAAQTDAIRHAFFALTDGEAKSLNEAPDMPATLRRLRHALDWSSGFHLALRREWARAFLLTRHPGRRETVAELENPLWYFPANDRPAWTAWSAVVELALRNLGRLAMRLWSGDPDTTRPVPDNPDAPAILGAHSLRPTVYLRRHTEPTAPLLALTVQVRGFDRPGKRPALPIQPARHVVWLFREDAIPWTQTRPPLPEADATEMYASPGPFSQGAHQRLAQPDASLLWDLAVADPAAALSHETREIIHRVLPDWGTALANPA